ncbi:hypothetical protein [uncultured Parasphingorhabdus sp.]|uniref:hypothetical protein n=1 Tax=uncultured Parasphingorhabdus sp. TaxID=2709694 RepID=UPI0030DA2B81|tara:strand:- start:10513 stop:10932 length:420 start_codon:yes stop_codon:yes gene_type:complete
MKIYIDQIVTIRKNRSELFNEQYFASKFWDIILLLYSHGTNGLPADANGISRSLDLNHRQVVRYLKVLLADGIICGFEQTVEGCLNVACDNISLTKTGFGNVETIMQQTRNIAASNHEAAKHFIAPQKQENDRYSAASD